MTTWRTVHLTQARQVAALMGVVAADLPAPEVTVRAHYDALRSADAQGAVDFIAHALPRLEAIHWAVSLLLDGAPAPDAAETHPAGYSDMVSAIRAWLDTPEDAARRKVHALSQQLERSLPERTLASAIFYSGGSIAPADAPPVLPVPGLANRLTATAIQQAAYRSGDAGPFISRALRRAEAIAQQGIDRRANV